MADLVSCVKSDVVVPGPCRRESVHVYFAATATLKSGDTTVFSVTLVQYLENVLESLAQSPEIIG